MANNDYSLSFILENGMSRGQSVRLSESLDEIIKRHNYPNEIGLVLSQAALLTVLLSAGVKYDGIFTLQIQGEGAIKALVVSLTTDGKIRGYVHYEDADLAKVRFDENGHASLSNLFGKGQMSFTTEKSGQTYQGIIALEGDTLTDCVLDYFEKSEQIGTQIKIEAIPANTEHGWAAGGILIQKMPFDKKMAELLSQKEQDDIWETDVVLLNSVRKEELTDLNLTMEKLLYRLYSMNDLHYFMPSELKFGCQCSQSRVINMLKGFTESDLDGMIKDGKIDITCQFCGEKYEIAPEQIKGAQ